MRDIWACTKNTHKQTKNKKASVQALVVVTDPLLKLIFPNFIMKWQDQSNLLYKENQVRQICLLQQQNDATLLFNKKTHAEKTYEMHF